MPNAWMPKALDPDELTLSKQAKKYGVSSRQIAEVNEVPFTKTAINDWVIEAGGKMLGSGWAVFEPGNIILLPAISVPEGQQAAAIARIVNKPSGLTTGHYLALGIGGGLLLLALTAEKAKKD